MSAPQPNGKQEQRFILTSFALGHMTNDWVGGTIWLIAPAIAASMGLGPAHVGLILTVNGIGAGLAYIPAGIATDRFSHQGSLLLITFWWVAAGYFCATLAADFWTITLLLSFGVMGDAFWHPVATGVLVKRMPTRRAQVLGIHAMGGSIGAEVLGPLTAGFLLGYFDWRSTLQILVVPAVIMGVYFIYVANRIGRTTQSKISRSDLRILLKQWSAGRGIALIVFMLLYNMSLIAILAMTPLFLMTVHGLSPLGAGMVFAAMVLFGTLMQPFLGKLSDRVGRKPVIIVFMTSATGFALLAGVIEQFAAFIFVLLLAATLLTAVRPVILASAVEFSGKSEATTLGIVYATLDGVGAFGALLAGWAGEIELSHAYILAAGLALVSTLFAVTLSFKPFHETAVTASAHIPPTG